MKAEPTPAQSVTSTHPLKRLGGIALAGPGAISVVGELSDKLSLSEILTRITVNFKAVSSAFWLQLEHWMHFRFPVDPPGMTMICLLVAPVFFQKYSLAEQKDGEVLVTISLGFTYLMMLYLMPELSPLKLGFLSVFFLFWAYVFSHIQHDKARFDFLTKGVLWTAVSLVVLEYVSVDPFHILDEWQNAAPVSPRQTSSLDLIPVLGVIMITVRKICLGSPGPLYIATLAAGVICLDKLATTIKPGIESWLTSIGA